MGKRLDSVFAVMRDLDWHTLADLASETNYPEASISAQLRELRLPAYGGWIIERRYVPTEPDRKTFEYRLQLPSTLPMFKRNGGGQVKKKATEET